MNTNIDRLDFATPCTICRDCKEVAHRIVTFDHDCGNTHAFTACGEHWLAWLLWFDRQRSLGWSVEITNIERLKNVAAS